MDFWTHYPEYAKMWDEPYRFYHGPSHLKSLMNRVDGNNIPILYFCLFHDIVYDPRSSVNEERSAEFFKSESHKFTDLKEGDVELIIEMILGTKDHTKRYKPDVAYAVALDMEILYSDWPTLLEYEEGIFKEFQFHPIEEYRKARVLFLRKFPNIPNIVQLANYIENRHYNVGIYAGSFNPFHIGHLDILRKAEGVFDKVVLVQGVNPDKVAPIHALPKSLPNEKIRHPDLITELFVKNKKSSFTMVRGMRNEFDVAAEVNYQSWVNELDPSIKFVHFFCDPQNTKISSSVLKSMSSFSGFDADKYIVR